MPKLQITNLDTGVVKVVDEIQSVNYTIKHYFNVITFPCKLEGGFRYHSTVDKKHNFKVFVFPEVILNYEDLLKISDYFCKQESIIREKVGPAFFELLLFRIIRDLKGVDFFKEEALINES